MRLRSLLFVPGDSEHKFAKASGLGADALILDLEDAVAPPRKALAREMVKNLLGGPPRDWAFLARINPLGSGLTLEDLAAIVRPGLDGILIPKVNGIADIELISNYVDVLEVAAGVMALDTMYGDFRDEKGLAESCRIARRDGFVGKIAIHPGQVATINQCFTPTEADLAHARRVVAAFAAEPDAGTLGIDGKMYDMPHLIAAKRALASAREDVT